MYSKSSALFFFQTYMVIALPTSNGELLTFACVACKQLLVIHILAKLGRIVRPLIPETLAFVFENRRFNIWEDSSIYVDLNFTTYYKNQEKGYTNAVKLLFTFII